ncbi:MAG TPA: hypothetical protein VMA31_03270 [Bryobacteraceae bacterium]|nr:hypothetical protein [Bryobacteraceae bacterium]
MKLYSSRRYPNRWYAHSRATGWVMFPSSPGGWEMRQPARGIDPVDVREVPVRLGFNSGVPESPDQLVLSPEAA